MINKEKAMADAIDAICRLDFKQLITLNAHLSEHISNVWNHVEDRQKVQKSHIGPQN
jgi:hypothetical protein